MIVSPVSRQLRIRDLARSRAFYRDKVGFADVVPSAVADANADAEMVLGPARLELVLMGLDEVASREVIFFEVDDVAAYRAELVRRGAEPGLPARVNWIKMSMFDLEDPDGHMLWFGQSFAEPPIELHTPAGQGQCRVIMPSFPVSHVGKTATHYREVLGFSVNYQQDDLAVLDRDSVRLLLTARTGQGQGTASCCVYVRDADLLYQELRAKGAGVGNPPVSRPWGLRDFSVVDPDGNEIVFAQTFE